MRKVPTKAYAVGELHDALRTALGYVDAVRAALEAQETGMKKTPMREFGEDPIFVRRACVLGVQGPTIVRRGCELEIAPRARRARTKPARRG